MPDDEHEHLLALLGRPAGAAIGPQPHSEERLITQSVDELANRIGFSDLEGGQAAALSPVLCGGLECFDATDKAALDPELLFGNGELTACIQGDGDLLVVTHIESKPSLGVRDGFFVGAPMNYQAFTNESLTMMYEATRGALAADDAVEREGGEPRFKVRDTPDWKKHAADLEAEMLRRGMLFDVIDWFEDQESLPFDK